MAKINLSKIDEVANKQQTGSWSTRQKIKKNNKQFI